MAKSLASASASASASTSTYKGLVSSAKHDFKIDFSYLKGWRSGFKIDSTPFTVDGHLFQVSLYPYGYFASISPYVSLFVKLLSNSNWNQDLNVWMDFYILDRFGDRWVVVNKAEQLVKMGRDEFYSHGPFIMNTEIHTRGYEEFYLRSALESSDFLKNDNLTIQCNVTVEKTPTLLSQLPPTSVFNDSLDRLFESVPGRDVIFNVEGELVEAHRCILSNRSDYFKALFDGQFNDNGIIEIHDMQAPIFKALLRYCYSDYFPEFDSPAIQHLLVAADRHCIVSLKKMCESKLCENLSAEHIGSCLALAERYKCPMLKSRCFWYIALPENTEDVMKTCGIKALMETCPPVMTELHEYIADRRSANAI